MGQPEETWCVSVKLCLWSEIEANLNQHKRTNKSTWIAVVRLCGAAVTTVLLCIDGVLEVVMRDSAIEASTQ